MALLRLTVIETNIDSQDALFEIVEIVAMSLAMFLDVAVIIGDNNSTSDN